MPTGSEIEGGHEGEPVSVQRRREGVSKEKEEHRCRMRWRSVSAALAAISTVWGLGCLFGGDMFGLAARQGTHARKHLSQPPVPSSGAIRETCNSAEGEGCRLGEQLCLWNVTGPQLGTGYSSNSSGDGPDISRCAGCNGTLPDSLKMCGSCYEKGSQYPATQCSVCHVLVGSVESKKTKMPKKRLASFNKYVMSDALHGQQFLEKYQPYRNLSMCPIRASDPLCMQTHCAFRESSNAQRRGDLSRARRHQPLSEHPGGRPRHVIAPKACHSCLGGEGTTRWRPAGGYFEAWELFFCITKTPAGLIKTRKFTPASTVCNRCYMSWYNDLKRREEMSAEEAGNGFVGSQSYLDAAAAEDQRSAALLRAAEGVGADKDFLAKEIIQVKFRAKILRDVFGAAHAAKVSDLSDVLREMIETDVACQHLGILGNASDNNLLERWVKRSLLVIHGSSPFWSRGSVAPDGRARPVIVFPMVVNRPQAASVVANMQEKIDARDLRIAELESSLAEAKAKRSASEPDDHAVVVRAATLLKEAVKDYGNESSALVRKQATGQVELSFDDPLAEYENNVPPLLGSFVDVLSHERPGDSDSGEGDVPLASRKCLIAGILTSFARNTWFKYANVVGIFLKHKGAGRGALDWLASHLKITQTDNYLWKLQRKLSGRLSLESEQQVLVPRNAELVATSFDNVNLDANRYCGANGHVDLVAAIAYFHVEPSQHRTAVLSEGVSPLEFRRDFSMEDERVAGIMQQFRLDVATTAQEPEPSTLRLSKEAGDFEVRLATMRISNATTDQGVGVLGRQVPISVIMRYLGVEELGTKTMEDIMLYLDRLKVLLHVGEDGGRVRVIVAGDQETYTLVHKAIKQYPMRYKWVIPWIGDWHLLEHTLDVMFRKWGGFGILHLAKASNCYDRKLEGKSYHKRHFVFVALLEALWKACASEVASESGSTDALSGEELLKELRSYLGGDRHKTFGQWVELLLVDGMAYLALYTSIRVGDFELREAAIRIIGPLFLGYNKNLYHALCIQHLADIATLLPNERIFAQEIFSLSLAGRVGKNVGLDEIQEMTMNKDLKTAANRPEVGYLKRLALVLQVIFSVAAKFELAFDSGHARRREVYATAQRTRAVAMMHAELLSDSSPFKLSDKEGSGKVIAADRRVALEHLERGMFGARKTSENMWRVGVVKQFPELRRHDSEGEGMRQRVRLDTFTAGPARKKPKTRAQGVKDRRLDDLQKIVAGLAKESERKEEDPIMVSGMPAQMGFFAGTLHGINKSTASRIPEKFAAGSVFNLPATDVDMPHTCAVDMATIIHQVGPKQRIDGSSWRRLDKWGGYAAFLVERLVWATCSREGNLAGEVILCFDKRKHVPPVKAFAHAVRFNLGVDTAGATSGSKGKARVTHKLRTNKKATPEVAPLWSRARMGFGLEDETPQAEEWREFLSDRQNRDNVFAVLCQYLRQELATIELAMDSGQTLSFAQMHISQVKLRVDGEPVPSADFSSTERYKSWSTGGGGIIVEEDVGNGIGEGELQALHHLWNVGRTLTPESNRRVEVISVDTDEWIAALLVYAVHPSTRNLRVVVRQQRGVGSRGEIVQHIDVLELFNKLTTMENWPGEFSELQKCLPVVVAYVLCGTDFTPTLHSLTSLSMFQAYYGYASNPTNAAFVRPLGSAPDGGLGEGLELNVEECIKFVGLCYFSKNSRLFEDALPGLQVNDSDREESHDEIKAWIHLLYQRTHVAHFAKAQWQDVVPEYDVLELHVKRMGWVLTYWLSTYLGRDQYPIAVPEWDGQGYVKDEDGVALMHLRRSPWVTLRPGQGIKVVSCNCKCEEGVRRCTTCVCAQQVGGTCSQLCKCRLVCGKGPPPGYGQSRKSDKPLQRAGCARVGEGSAAQQSGGAGSEQGEPFSSLAELQRESSDDEPDDGDESCDGGGDLPGLHEFAEQLRDASGFGEDDVAEYMDDLQAEHGTEPLRFTVRDVTRAHSGRTV